MNIFYKNVLKIKSLPVKVLIVIFGMIISIASFCLAINSLSDFKTEKNAYHLFTHILFIFCSYFFFNLFSLQIYSKTYDAKKRILLEEREGNAITKWLYTKKESDLLKKHYALQKKDEKRALYFISFLVIGIPCLIIAFVGKSESLEMIYIVVISLGIILLASRDFNNYNKVLKEDTISVIFTKMGYVISDSYTGAFNINHRRLTSIDYNKKTNKILFSFSIFSPGVEGDLDSKYTILEEFPVPERYTDEANKLKRVIPTYSSF